MSAQNTPGWQLDIFFADRVCARRVEIGILWLPMDTHRIDNPYSGGAVAERRFLATRRSNRW